MMIQTIMAFLVFPGDTSVELTDCETDDGGKTVRLGDYESPEYVAMNEWSKNGRVFVTQSEHTAKLVLQAANNGLKEGMEKARREIRKRINQQADALLADL